MDEHGDGVVIDITDEGQQVMLDILAERNRQDAKWGEQNHDPFCYLAILGEEYGEVCKAALHLKFNPASREDMERLWNELRTEAVQTAAVAMALVECLDRDKWQWGVYEGNEQ